MQLEFVHDSRYCTGCFTCQVACKDLHSLETGCLYRKVIVTEGGGFYSDENGAFFNDVYSNYVSISCEHCVNPACVKACPAHAVKKEVENGIVWIDETICIGCGVCKKACPNDVPQKRSRTGRMGKCDLCRDRLKQGKNPVCVDACPLHLLQIKDRGLPK